MRYRMTGWVLRHLSLQIGAGEFVCLVGSSGVGKTTLLRAVAGLAVPDEGEIYLDGQVLKSRQSAVGYVFQEDALLPWRTALHNVTFGLELRGYPPEKRRQIGLQMMALVGLDGNENAFPHQLSGGMRQRVGIARALAIQPSVLLMDEPFNALDVRLRRQLQQTTLHVWRQLRPAVLFVTHDLREAVFLATRIIVLGGRPAKVIADVTVPTIAAARDSLITELVRLVDNQGEGASTAG